MPHRMPSNKAVGYDDDGEAPLVDWDWAAPAIQAYSTTNDLHKVGNSILNVEFKGILTLVGCYLTIIRRRLSEYC